MNWVSVRFKNFLEIIQIVQNKDGFSKFINASNSCVLSLPWCRLFAYAPARQCTGKQQVQQSGPSLELDRLKCRPLLAPVRAVTLNRYVIFQVSVFLTYKIRFIIIKPFEVDDIQSF
jgi:hypothetical protein